MNIKQAFTIALSLALIFLAVYTYTQSNQSHLFATINNLSLRTKSVFFGFPTQSHAFYQEAKIDTALAIDSTVSVIAKRTWQDKLHQFQLTLDRIRKKFINDFKLQITKCVSCNNKTTVLDEFLNVRHRHALKNLSKVNVLVGHVDVSWFDGNETNKSAVAILPTQRTFKLFATPPVCDHLPMKVWQQIISCNLSEIDRHAANPSTTSIVVIDSENEVSRYSPLQYNLSESLYSYVNIFTNASINDIGSIKARDGCVTVLPIACKTETRDTFLYDESDSRVHIVDEVFTIAQYWGYGYFHATIENLPRMAPFVEFLQRHPHIRLHVALNSNYDRRTAEHVTASLAVLGIDPKRLVSGHIRAKIAYLPRSTPCGYGLMPELQILSWRFRNYIANSLNEMEHASVVLIIREGSKTNGIWHVQFTHLLKNI
jgi:hypothetical protein